MEGNDENNIDEFALEILRRAKERSQVISGKIRQPETTTVKKEQSIEKIMEKLENKSSSSSSLASPVKVSYGSPVKSGTRPILKPPNNDNSEGGVVSELRSVKKTVTTFDALTGDTIVEAKTFISDDEDDDGSEEDAEMNIEENELGPSSIIDEPNEIPNDEEVEYRSEAVKNDTSETPKADNTPQLSRTLKKLAEFHSHEEVDSPVHSHTPLETFNHGHNKDENNEIGAQHVSASRRARTSRLSALARTINEWEDDTSHLSIPGSRFHDPPPTNNNTRSSLAGKTRFSSACSPSASSPLSLGTSKQGQTNGVRLFCNSNISAAVISSSNYYNNSDHPGDGLNKNGGGGSGNNNGTGNFNLCNNVDNSSNNNRLGFEETVLTKLQNNIQKPLGLVSNSVNGEDWDEALMKSLELQGFSRRQASPLKQIREKTPDPLPESDDDEDGSTKQKPSPKKTYFGGSPSKTSPYKSTPPQMQTKSPANSPARFVVQTSPSRSPTKSTTPVSPVVVNSSTHFVSSNNGNSRRSSSPMKSSVKSSGFGSPRKGEKTSSSESTPSGKPVSAIRMRFEGGGAPSKIGPAKPERSRLKPYSAPVGGGGFKSVNSSSPTKKFYFGETEKDPSTLSVAERAKLFENSKFCLSSAKKPTVETHMTKSKTPIIFTSSPCTDNVKLQDIDVSSVVPVSVEPEVTSPKKRAAPLPPKKAPSPINYGKGPAPPPPPPMPNTSTPTNASSKRRSTSPVRAFPKESQLVKRIKVNAPKPGRMYPSLTDIETETETEAEGHCSEVESMDDSIGSEQSLGAEIVTMAKSCSPIRPSGGRMPSRYRPSEDFSATFACAAVDALIDEALEGQDMTSTTILGSSTALYEAEKTVVNACPADHEHSAENHSASLERTVVSVENSAEVSTSSQEDSLNDVPLEPDALEERQEDSCSEADTTASSSFTSSPVALSNFYSKPDAVANNVDNANPVEMQTVVVPRQDPPNPPEQLEEEPFVPRPLMHTVSFYRKQQQQQKKTETFASLNDISEQPEGNESSDEEVPVAKPNITALIKKLESEVEGRNLAIAQASKALNWCKTLVGFSDSTEYIECERILLIETQRRLALLNSIHRLKTEGALNYQLPIVFSPGKQELTPSCKGNMKISDISVTLRRDFFNAHRAENQYHFIGLVKNKHHIEHTALLTYDSQKQGSILRFTNEFALPDLNPDFQINLEIYYLESAKEFLPHEAKYRINAKKDSKQGTMLSPMLTPSKKGGKDHHKPSIHSPAGPDTVKSSSFKFCGGLSVDISSLQRTYWELDKAAGPLTGGVSLKVQCSAMGGGEHKGFLTLFEDVSGYGAWVRRWCRLGPAVLEFWKYPEDEIEGRKPPLGTLNLHECVTSKVRPAPRDVCARANTLLLVTTRAPHPNDKDTLVTSCHRGYTAVRHLISADTREERDVWSQSLNKALANLRAWDPVAKQSVDDSLF